MNELLRRILFLPPQASTVAAEIDALHYFVILTTMAGATLVTLVGGWFIVRYRRRRPDGAEGRKDAKLSPPLWAEIVVIAGLLGLFCLFWVIGMRQFMRLRIAPEGAMDVWVTGKQWMWKFAYPQGASAVSVLYVPAGRPVRLFMVSRDVIHSFYVPDFRIKQDVLPGRYSTVWFEAKQPGVYPILCTEYCGAGHSTMRGQVVALSPADFERWLSGTTALQPPAGPVYEPPAVVGEAAPAEPLSLARIGERAAAEHGCLRCHTTDGTPHIGPTWAGLYESKVPLEKGGHVVADDAYLTESMMDPLAKLHRGYEPVMPSYRGLLGAADAAAIVELIRALRDVPVPAEQTGARPPAGGGAP